MNDDYQVSDEHLNAFIDNELDTEEWTHMVEMIRTDESLAGRVCELRQLKDMVQMSYRAPDSTGHEPFRARRRRWDYLTALAASIALVVSSVVAWDYFRGGNRLDGGFAQVAQLDPARQDANKILVHIATADGEKLKAALDDTEELLSAYQARSQKVQVEIVANAEGVELLRSDTSPYVERIAELITRYDNLAFLACSRSLEKLRMKGIDVHLLPDVGVVPGALEEIVTRLQEGWVYIKI